MKRIGRSQDIAATKGKHGTLPQDELRNDAVELTTLLRQFAYQPVYFTQVDEETGKAKARLEDLLKTRWRALDRDVVQKGCALFEWVLLCPPLLKGQPGFEWVQQSFVTLLQRRLHYWDVGQKATRDHEGRFEGVDDQLFWAVVEVVRGRLNRGHPQTLVKDYERANLVFNLTMLKNSETGQQIELPEATIIVARYEVLQRVLDADRFLEEVGGLSENEAKRIMGSWGIAQRKGAIGFLTGVRNYTNENAERFIDEWNVKRRLKRAVRFLTEKHKYSQKQAEGLVAQWKLDTDLGKVTAIEFLMQSLRYNDSQAERIVSRWGTTGEVAKADPSPINRALRKVEALGRWSHSGNIGHSDKDYAQQVVHIVLTTMSEASVRLKDAGGNQSAKKKGHAVKVLRTKALLETIQEGRKSHILKTRSRKTNKRKKT